MEVFVMPSTTRPETRLGWLGCGLPVLLAITVCLASCQGQVENDPQAAVLERGIRYLLDQQDADGLWRSPNYGNLKQGAGITALVVYALGAAREHLSDGDREKLQKAVDALLPAIRQHGYVSNPDGPDYSNYGSALLLTGCRQAGLELPEDIIGQLVAYLVRAQLDEGEGFDATSPDYGGWDLTGWMSGPRPTTGTSISVTASVLEALQAWPDQPGVGRARGLAVDWLTRCQNVPGDGGFFFHPRRNHDGNKAGWNDEARNTPRSYGSATVDGIRGNRFAGSDTESAAIRNGHRWLRDNRQFAVVPGFPDSPDGRSWQTGLRYYYYSSFSDLPDELTGDQSGEMKQGMLEQMQQQQRDDGSWSNPVARMREDDPVIATAFAVTALARILRQQER